MREKGLKKGNFPESSSKGSCVEVNVRGLAGGLGLFLKMRGFGVSC